jgi:ABC-2 type transport system ATP-binding protein
MKSILGLNTNYQGEINFHGEKLTPSDENMKTEIGSLVDVSFYDDMTAYQNLKVVMMLTKAIPAGEQDKRIHELLSFVGLEPSSKKSVRSFSFGMKQRLALAQAIITKPVLLNHL